MIFKKPIAIILFLLPLVASTKEVELFLDGGNKSSSYYGAAAAMFATPIAKKWELAGGFKGTSEKTYHATANSRYTFAQRERARYSVGATYLYSYYQPYSISHNALSLYLHGMWRKHWEVSLGLTTMLFSSKGITPIYEPLALYWGFGYHVKQIDHRWNIGLFIKNFDDFVLSRSHEIFYTVKGSYDITDHYKVSLSATTAPAGAFHLTEQIYNTYLRVSVCYKW